MRAADPALAAVILTELAGHSPEGLGLPPDDQMEIHLQLGRLLRDFHASEPNRPAEPPADELAEVQRCLNAAGTRITPGEGVLVGRMAVRLVTLPPLPCVPTHGDPGLHNTLWDTEAKTLALIDFENARYASAIRDLVCLEYGSWEGHPDLRSAFFEGFGRDLTRLETAHLEAIATVDAVSAIAFDATNCDSTMAARGHRMLARVAAQTRT